MVVQNILLPLGYTNQLTVMALTKLQITILQYLVMGYHLGEIAFLCDCSYSTVNNNLFQARLANKALTSEQLVAQAVNRGIVSVE